MADQIQFCLWMASYDDLDGVQMTVQSARVVNNVGRKSPLILECGVVDNNPDSQAGKDTRAWCAKAMVRYHPLREPKGTAPPRDECFRQARGDYVVVVDSHVVLFPGSLHALADVYRKDPLSPHLYQGPIASDYLTGQASVFVPRWRGGMCGVWAQTFRAPDGTAVAVDEGPGRTVRYVTLTDPPVEVPGPRLPWDGHQRGLVAEGYTFMDAQPDPYEIPAMGLGLFACRKDAWPGFHPRHVGFGGEEVYVHRKFRKLGRKCYCVPGLWWWHRFRQEGQRVRYPLDDWDRVWNYLNEWHDLGLPFDDVRAEFVGRFGFPAAEFERMAAAASAGLGVEEAGLERPGGLPRRGEWLAPVQTGLPTVFKSPTLRAAL